MFLVLFLEGGGEGAGEGIQSVEVSDHCPRSLMSKIPVWHILHDAL